jgi:hypothetical protein
MKIHSVGAESFHTNRDRQTDRQTDRQAGRQADMMKLIVAFCNSANTPKMTQVILTAVSNILCT